MSILKFIVATVIIVPLAVLLDDFAWVAWTIPGGSIGRATVWGVVAVAANLAGLVVIVRLFISAVRPTTEIATVEMTRRCPHCLSDIPRAAAVCRYCQRDVPAFTQAPSLASYNQAWDHYAHQGRTKQNP